MQADFLHLAFYKIIYRNWKVP